MRKKFLLGICLFLFVLTGCELNNNPTSKVEELLGNYQGLDKKISYNYVALANDSNLDQDIIEKYEDLIKKQYRNLSYEVKEEVIDGGSAVVTVQIDVLNYKKVLDNYSSYTLSSSEHEKIINELKKVKDKVTYTIDFSVTKNKNGDWKLDDLTTEEEQKLLGIY